MPLASELKEVERLFNNELKKSQAKRNKTLLNRLSYDGSLIRQSAINLWKSADLNRKLTLFSKYLF